MNIRNTNEVAAKIMERRREKDDIREYFFTCSDPAGSSTIVSMSFLTPFHIRSRSVPLLDFRSLSILAVSTMWSEAYPSNQDIIWVMAESRWVISLFLLDIETPLDEETRSPSYFWVLPIKDQVFGSPEIVHKIILKVK